MRPSRIVLALAAAGAVLAPFAVDGRFVWHIAILIGIKALLALSLHLMLRIGQLSLAQAGFMGMGAYTSALLTRDLGLPFLLGMSAAIAIPALAAWLIGSVILKVRGVHFALLTFVLGEAIVLGVRGVCRLPFGRKQRESCASRPPPSWMSPSAAGTASMCWCW